MADLIIVAANVVKGANAQEVKSIIAAEAITAGQAVRKRSADALLELSDASDNALDDVLGIAQNSVAVGQPCDVQTGGTITLGVGIQGVPYFLSEAAPGGIAPLADLITSGVAVVPLGVGTGAGIALSVFNSGVDKP